MSGRDHGAAGVGDVGRSGGRPTVDASRATYRQEVTAAQVGRRVSVRFLVDDGEGPRPTDRVGRLLSCEDDGWIVVDRDGVLHVIDPVTIVASREVPTHPRLPAEPTGTSASTAIRREAARVLLLDPDDRVLLVAHLPGDGRTVWTAPGGGLDPGESHEQAAARELREEVALDGPLGPWIWSRTATFRFRDIWIEQHERWFLVRSPTVDVDTMPLDDLATAGARWWSPEELRTTGEVIAPRALAAHLDVLLAEGPPARPVDVGP